MCTNVHATRHWDSEGYELVSMNMVSFVIMEEVDEIILEVKKTLGLDYSGSYDEKIIVEGSQVDTLRICQGSMRADEIPVPCMPLQTEISLDGSLETFRNDKIE